MNIAIYTSTILVLITLLMVANYFSLPYLIKEMAERDFIFTIVKEGYAKIIISSGSFKKVVFSYEHRWMKKPGKKDLSAGKCSYWDIIPYSELREVNPDLLKDKSDEEIDKIIFEEKSRLEKRVEKYYNRFGLNGIFLVGWPGIHSVYKYNFAWTSVTEVFDSSAGATKYTLKHNPKREIDYVLLKPDVYAFSEREAEDKNMVPLTIDCSMPIAIRNPYKASFKVQKWLEMIWQSYLPKIRKLVGSLTWEQLKSRGVEEEEAIYKEVAPSDDEANNFLNRYGIVILEFNFLTIDPAGKRKETYEEAATGPYFAE